MLIKITRGCYVEGKPRSEGEVVDVAPAALLDLLAAGAGQAVDKADIQRAVDDARRRTAQFSRMPQRPLRVA